MIKTDASPCVEYSYLAERNDDPLVRILFFTQKYIRTHVTEVNKVLFVMEGSCEITSDIYPVVALKSKEAMFLPAGSRFDFNIQALSKIVVIQLDPYQSLHESYSIEELFEEYKKFTFDKKAGILPLNEALMRYLINISVYLQSGFFNHILYDIKIKELLFVLYGYYEKRELCDFFKPILNNDFAFATFIMNNWMKAKNVKKLAELSAYCETGFNKKFKRAFGITPYKWLNEKRSGKIIYEILNTDKSFKEIAEKYNFNSLQQFNDYCIRNFKKTPGRLRKR